MAHAGLALAALLMAGTALAAEPGNRNAAASDADLLREGVAALTAPAASRDALAPARAIAPLAELAARNGRDGTAQALLALAYQQAGDAQPESGELALAGYDLALKADPANALAAGLAGRLAFQRGRSGDAAEFYARAVMADPQSAGALAGLAGAAYMAGDVALAALAAERAASLATPHEPMLAREALRLAVLAHGAAGDAVSARAALARLSAQDAAVGAQTAARLAQIEQTNPIDAGAGISSAQPSPDGESPDQVSVDVAIVLSQNTRREQIGMNLLDGLTLNYSYGNQYTRTRLTAPGVEATVNTQRVITQAIGIPQLTYNLNLFNRSGQYYSVVARPSLTAYRGETSEFFVGRSLKVAVSGVNVAGLEQIDVGIEMKVTPIEITPEGTRVRIEATRSFLTSDAAGRFNEALTTFRQRVAATAEVRFGETLILSGLSEHVDDRTFSKTPGLGDVPVVQNLFRQKNSTQRQDAALILVTPSRPGRLPGLPFVRGEALGRLTSLWTQVIDPEANAASVAAQLARSRSYTRMRAADARPVWPDPDGAPAQVVAGLLAQGGIAWPEQRP